MADKFRNRYRIASARAPFWDYGWNAAYFVTICTQHHTHYFGDVRNGSVHLSKTGEIADYCWLQIPQHFPFVKLGAHIIMPNHVHGIVISDKPDDGRGGDDNRHHGRDAINRVSTNTNTRTKTTTIVPTNGPGGFAGDNNPMLQHNLSKIIRWYKGRTTFESRKNQTNFAWQPRFHDRIIRDNGEYQRISNYIVNNPLKWREDPFYNR